MDKEKVSIRDVQKAGLKILLEFTRICDENNLTYYLSGGTFLGAVRHKGFIPWDDDIDVAMPRKDYNHFLKIAPSKLNKRFKLVHYASQKNTIHYFAKIEDCSIQLIDHTASIARKVNLWIDIFPLDGLPENPFPRKIHCFRLLGLRALFKYSLFETIVEQNNRNRPWYENFLITVGKYIKFSRILNPDKRMKALDKALSKYDFYSSPYVMSFMGAYKFRSVMEREKVYGKGAYYPFEGYHFRAPENYDAFLSKIYGDYMKLPPENQRNRHQTTIVQKQQ